MSPWLQLLYQAEASPMGIIVLHENPTSAREQFNIHRRGHPEVQGIRVVLLESAPDRLYLVKTSCLETSNPSSESTSGSSNLTEIGSRPITEKDLE
jgi:hypothetical protein